MQKWLCAKFYKGWKHKTYAQMNVLGYNIVVARIFHFQYLNTEAMFIPETAATMSCELRCNHWMIWDIIFRSLGCHHNIRAQR